MPKIAGDSMHNQGWKLTYCKNSVKMSNTTYAVDWDNLPNYFTTVGTRHYGGKYGRAATRQSAVRGLAQAAGPSRDPWDCRG